MRAMIKKKLPPTNKTKNVCYMDGPCFARGEMGGCSALDMCHTYDAFNPCPFQKADSLVTNGKRYDYAPERQVKRTQMNLPNRSQESLCKDWDKTMKLARKKVITRNGESGVLVRKGARHE